MHRRYALDVNVERAEDVLMHKRLLELAHDPDNRPSIEIRLVQVTDSMILQLSMSYTLIDYLIDFLLGLSMLGSVDNCYLYWNTYMHSVFGGEYN